MSEIVHAQEPFEHDKIMSSIVPEAEDEVPIIDYSMLVSSNPEKRDKALDCLAKACEKYGCFYILNHGVPNEVIDNALRGTSKFYELTTGEEREEYQTKNPSDRIRRYVFNTNGEMRECMRLVTNPQFHCPPKPTGFSEAMEAYVKMFKEIKLGLARALSNVMGFEECYLEKALNLESGFDVAFLRIYPPQFEEKGFYGVPPHSDPGFVVSHIENCPIKFDILAHNGKWVSVKIPPYSMFVHLGDHVEVLTNGKYRCPTHQAIQDNERDRISIAIIHGPSLDTVVTPALEFVDESHPPVYRGMTYKDSLEANGHHLLDALSNVAELRL